MKRKKNSWNTLARKSVVKHNLFEVQLHEVKLPNGKIIHDYLYIKPNNGVIIVAIDNDEIVMLEDYKYAVNDAVITFPGGLCDTKYEKSLSTAKRELVEETGYVCQNYKLVGEILPMPGNNTNRTQVFFASGCSKLREQNLDETENIKVKVMKVKKIFKLVRENKINDGMTMAAFLLVREILCKLIK